MCPCRSPTPRPPRLSGCLRKRLVTSATKQCWALYSCGCTFWSQSVSISDVKCPLHGFFSQNQLSLWKNTKSKQNKSYQNLWCISSTNVCEIKRVLKVTWVFSTECVHLDWRTGNGQFILVNLLDVQMNYWTLLYLFGFLSAMRFTVSDLLLKLCPFLNTFDIISTTMYFFSLTH